MIHIRSALLTVFSAAFLASCAAPPPPPPPPAKTAVVRKKAATPKPAAQVQQPSQSERGRLVDGRFIRDTPPEQVEPAKTIRVEKDF